MDQRWIESLLKTSAYPEPTTTVELLQTHVSYIFITDRFVYKVKKPVDFGFLNFTTLDRRRFYCEEEVRLNRRLCPDIYLGVVQVRESAGVAAFQGEGTTIDYAVKMERLPEERMLSRLLQENRVTAADMREIARTVAKFHLKADRGGEIESYGGLETIRQNWHENFQQVAAVVGICLSRRDLDIIRSWATGFMERHAPIFAGRVAQGFIRDCDGDIHAENICLGKRVCIFDCIEFNKRFRFIDTAADIAFLLMDLDYHLQTSLGEAFLDEYVKVSGDSGAVEVLAFYKIYRAFVRGKVESFRLRDPDIRDMEREEARRKATRYFRLARGYILRQQLPPSLIAICGLMGSGKSTIAAELALELGIEVLSSDRVRKEITGVPLTEHAPAGYDQGIYASAYNRATYGELEQRADNALRAGRTVIVDATFRRRDDRALFRRLAEGLHIPFYLVEARCADAVIKDRLETRQRDPDEVSDGRWELFRRQQGEFEPIDPGEGRQISVDTSGTIVDNINHILAFLGILRDVA